MKKMHVTIARGGVFGKLSSREVNLGSNNFVVLSGDNESGKSTLAEMISWTIAGRRFGEQVDKKFVTLSNLQASANLLMDARIEGLIDADHFMISRQFTIRAAKKGTEPAAIPPVITVKGQTLNGDDWGSMIKIHTDRDYSRIYRVMEPYDGGDKKMNLKDLFEVLTFHTDLGIAPKDVEELLDKQAALLVNARGGRTTDKPFSLAHSRFEAASKQHEEILNSNGTITSLDNEIEQDQDTIIALENQLEKARKAKGDLATANNLLRVRDRRKEVDSELSEITLSDSWDSSFENRADVQSCLDDLEANEKHIDRVSNDINRLKHDLGVHDSDIDVIVIDRQTVDQIGQLQRERSDLLERIEQELKTRIEKASSLVSASESIERLAKNFGTSSAHMLELGEKSLDDQSFGDPILSWNTSSNSLQEASSNETVIVQSSTNANPHQRRLIGVMGISFALTTLAMLVDKTIGIGIAAIGIIAILASLKVPKKQSDGNNSSTQTPQSTKSVNNPNLHNDLKVKREKALNVLRAFGFEYDLSLDQAISLRSDRFNIRDLVQALNAASAECLRIDNEIVRVNQTLAEVSKSLSKIAVSISPSISSDELTSSIAAEFLKLVGSRDELEILLLRHTQRKQELKDFLGDWVTDESFVQIRLKVGEVNDLIQNRNELRTESEQLRRSIEISAPAGSSIAQILADGDINSTVIVERLMDIDKDIARFNQEKDFITGNIAVNKKNLENLEKISDLPEVVHKKTQAKEDVKRFAMQGASALLAKRIVADVRKQVESQHKELVVHSSEIANRITGGFWTSIANDDNGVRVLQGGQWILEDALSAGARDVLRLSIRLAAVRAHSQSRGVALPLILDDPTASIDKKRCPRLFEVLKEFAEDFQIILMTHDSAIVDLAVAAGAFEVSLSPD